MQEATSPSKEYFTAEMSSMEAGCSSIINPSLAASAIETRSASLENLPDRSESMLEGSEGGHKSAEEEEEVWEPEDDRDSEDGPIEESDNDDDANNEHISTYQPKFRFSHIRTATRNAVILLQFCRPTVKEHQQLKIDSCLNADSQKPWPWKAPS